MPDEKKISPRIEGQLRHSILKLPRSVYQATGIVVNGRRIKSFVFTTDLAIIRNCDADAVFAVYPFTPQQAISDAIIKASYIPVFCGVELRAAGPWGRAACKKTVCAGMKTES